MRQFLKLSTFRIVPWLLTGLLGLFSAPAQTAAAPLAADSAIEYDPTDRTLTLHASGAPLPQLLEAITKETGVVFKLPEDQKLGNGPVIMTFDKMPLERAIRQLLRRADYAMVYHQADNVAILDRVQVISLSEEGTAVSTGDVFGSTASAPSSAGPPTIFYTPEELQQRREERQQRQLDKSKERAEKLAAMGGRSSGRSRGRQLPTPPPATTPEPTAPAGGQAQDQTPTPGK